MRGPLYRTDSGAYRVHISVIERIRGVEGIGRGHLRVAVSLGDCPNVKNLLLVL